MDPADDLRNGHSPTSRLREVARLLRRHPGMTLLVLRSYVLLLVMRGVITAFPLRRITARLGTPMEETSEDGVPEPQMRYARQVAWAVRKLAPRTPTNSNCYPQALTAWWLLHRKGIPTTFYYGAAFEPDRSALGAHVWLRCGPLVVTGGGTGREFAPLTWFADEGAAGRSRQVATGEGVNLDRRPVARRRILVPLVLIVLGAATVVALMVLRPHDDVPVDPDAVVVLGGVGAERFDLGLQLATDLDAPLVLSSSATYFAARRGYRCAHVDHCLLLPRSTAEEARAVAELAAQQGWSRVTVVTSSHHTTRARVLFRQCLGDGAGVVGAPRPDGVSVKEWAWEVAGTLAALTVRRAC